MSTYGVWGRLGAGKTKFAAWCLLGAVKNGKRAAGNIDFKLDSLPHAKASYTRVPDKPTARDLDALGHGNPDSYDEDMNGVLVLDELATWLNARTFQDKERAAVLDWLVHARKKGWDVYFLMQHPNQVDKQLREALLEYSVACRKLDRVRIPIFGVVLQRLGMRGTFPKGTHGATIRLGFEQGAPLVESIVYKGAELHELFDTRQVFVHNPEAVSVTWLHSRRFEASEASRVRLRWWQRPPPKARPELKPKLPHVAALMRLPADRRLRLAASLGV